MNPYVIALTVLVFYIAIIFYLKRQGILQRLGLELWGPLVIWRTQAGKRLIDKLAIPKRFWRGFATLSKLLCVVVMVFIMGLLIWEATLVTSIPAESAPTPEMMLGIPGLNPLIPIWYGILGLVVAIVVHEFAHGILTRVGDMKLKSLGLVFLIFPLGAFVEPDEEELGEADKKKRTNVYAVGPATNVIVAIICALLFSSLFLGSVAPVRGNPVVVQVGDDSPAEHAGLRFGSQIVMIDSQPVGDSDDLEDISAPAPGEFVSVQYYYEGEMYTKDVVSGVTVTQATSGMPAADAGIKKGMIIVSINDTEVRNPAQFSLAMDLTRPHQTVNITVLAYYSSSNSYEVFPDIHEVTLDSKKEYLSSVSPEEADDLQRDIGFLGINQAYLGASATSADRIMERLAHPFSGAESVGDYFTSMLFYISLPFTGLAPIQSSITDLYTVQGAMSIMPMEAFWLVANSLYWVFWINLMVGLTNVLPAVPLDGGYLFRDAMDGIVKRLDRKASEKKREEYVSKITYILALVVLALILWQLIGPRVL